MAYEILMCKNVDLTSLGYEDASLYFDYNKEKKLLRVTLFNGHHYKDEITIDLEAGFGGKTTP